MQLSARAPRPGGHRRRSPLRRPVTAAGLGLVALLGAGVLAPLVVAQERPEKLLQAVSVDLGTDGSLFGLTSTEVRRSKDGSDTTTRQLDPRALSSALPFRVTTAWAHDGKVGTDLADLAGVDGLVEVSVTVQNTTVRPQLVRYDTAGVARDGYALVGTPLTVVASATLPEAAFGQLQQPRPGTASPHTTNGVVSRAGGATTVQWASLLAPPRLDASTTFTLVQQAKDFRMPHLDLSVQPGLATDTSVSRLVGDAFGGSAAFVGAQNNTIGLIASINTTLGEAVSSLTDVQETLSANAGEVGAAATERLNGASADIDSASQAVLSDLASLNTTVAGTLQQTRSDSLTALQASLDGITAYLGEPTDAPAPPTTTTCLSGATKGQPASSTLLGQLSQVSDGLTRLAGSSTACVNTLRAQLSSFIGDATACPAVPSTTGPLVCQLQTTGLRLSGVATTMAQEGARILGAFDAEATQKVSDRIAALVGSVKDLQAQAAPLKPGSASSVGALGGRLEALRAAVLTARKASTDGDSSLLKAFADLHDLALLRGSPLANGLASGLQSLAESVCSLPPLRGVDVAAARAYADSLRAQVDGGTCDFTDATPSPTASPSTSPSPSASPSATPTVGTGPVLPVPLPGDDDDAGDDAPGSPSPTADPLGPLVDSITRGRSGAGGLLAAASADVALWQQVAALTEAPAKVKGGGNGGGGKSALDDVLGVSEQLVGLQDEVEAALGIVRGTSEGAGRGSLQALVDDVVARSSALYDPAAATADCGATAPTGGVLNTLERSFSALSCNQRSTGADLTKLLKDSVPAYGSAATSVGTSATDLDGARRAGDTQLASLLTSLTGQLTSTADAQLVRGRQVVAVQRQRLDAQKTAAARKLDDAARAAVGTLAEQVARSNTQQQAASQALQGQLSTVLLDLGSGTSGRGLLGTIQDSVGQTGVKAAQVTEASDSAAQFRGVRLAELADARLEQRTAAQALRQAQTFPAFALDLPAGSAHSTVFTLAMRPVG